MGLGFGLTECRARELKLVFRGPKEYSAELSRINILLLLLPRAVFSGEKF